MLGGATKSAGRRDKPLRERHPSKRKKRRIRELMETDPYWFPPHYGNTSYSHSGRLSARVRPLIKDDRTLIKAAKPEQLFKKNAFFSFVVQQYLTVVMVTIRSQTPASIAQTSLKTSTSCLKSGCDVRISLPHLVGWLYLKNVLFLKYNHAWNRKYSCKVSLKWTVLELMYFTFRCITG